MTFGDDLLSNIHKVKTHKVVHQANFAESPEKLISPHVLGTQLECLSTLAPKHQA